MAGRYTERIAESFTHYPPVPFSYNPETLVFNIGVEQVALHDYQTYVAPGVEPISHDQALVLIDESTLLLNAFNNHFQMPRMYHWLKSLGDKPWQDVQ